MKKSFGIGNQIIQPRNGVIGLLIGGLNPLKLTMGLIAVLIIGAVLINRSPIDDWAAETLAYGWIVVALWTLTSIVILRSMPGRKVPRFNLWIATSLVATMSICLMGTSDVPFLSIDAAGYWGGALAGTSLSLLLLKLTLLALCLLSILSRQARSLAWSCFKSGIRYISSNGKSFVVYVSTRIWRKSTKSRFDPLVNIHIPTLYSDDNHPADLSVERELCEIPSVGIPKYRRSDNGTSAQFKATAAVVPESPVTTSGSGEALPWVLPYPGLLANNPGPSCPSSTFDDYGQLVRETLAEHGIPVDVANVEEGPRTISLGIVPGWIAKPGKAGLQSSPDVTCKSNRVKVQSILSRKDDLALALGTPNIRLQAPVPGKPWVGLEIPQDKSSVIYLGDVLAASSFSAATKDKHLPVALGIDSHNTPVVLDLAGLPHVLIGGKTGSGKSACLNSMICSLIMTKTPDELQLLMLDPKRVEFAPYVDIPHLLSPVVVEAAEAAETLELLIEKMLDRLKIMQSAGSRNIQVYNGLAKKPMPYIVAFVDELADLITSEGGKTENNILRIAQLGRAAGIHLVLATQRPSVDVVPGTIKANMPTRIAFSMSSAVDSRVILDCPGAETLLGKGDMFLRSAESQDLTRVQGALVPDEDITRLLRHWSLQISPLQHAEQAITKDAPPALAANR